MAGKRRSIEEIILADVDKALGLTAQELTEQIEIAYERTINKFYSDWSPHSYQRKERLYSASDHFNSTFRDPETMRDGDGYLAGILVNSDFMDDTYEYSGFLSKFYGQDDVDEFVFERSFDKGIHGFNSTDVKRVNDAKDAITIKINELLVSKGSTKLTITKRWKPGTIPTISKKKPHSVMDAAFKKIAKTKNINNIFIKKYLTIK